MRICLIAREYPPDTGWGGIATFTYQLAYGLKELGHEVEVISLTKDHAVKIDRQPESMTNENGIAVHRVQAFAFPGGLNIVSLCMPYSRYMFRTATALWDKFLTLHQKKPFDVVDTPELLAEGVYPAITKAAPLVVRLYTPHSKFIAEGFHNVTPSFDHLFVAALERVAMLSADVLTSPSLDLAWFVAQDLNIPVEQIHIIRNPIDAAQFSPHGNHALPNDERPTVLFVGRLEERKGITYLIQAVPTIVQAFPNVRILIIGDDTNNAAGQKSQHTELARALRQFGCTENVTFMPRIPLAELPAYYRSADVCVVPSVYDNSPYTCLEAMSCGRAVVGTTAGGTKEYIVDGHSGVLIPPQDVSAIAGSVIMLLRDKDKRLLLGNNARQRVLDQYQRRQIAQQTEALYQLALRQHEKKQFVLYRKGLPKATEDAASFLCSYDKTLYDLLYLYSWRFRVRHWCRRAVKRPKLFGAQLLVKLSKLALWLTGRRVKSANDLVAHWEEQIHLLHH